MKKIKKWISDFRDYRIKVKENISIRLGKIRRWSTWDVLIWVAALFIMFAFLFWDVHPKNWGIIGRSILSSMILVILYYSKK